MLALIEQVEVSINMLISCPNSDKESTAGCIKITTCVYLHSHVLSQEHMHIGASFTT